MVQFAQALANFLRGCNRTAVFAITTQCNCKCIMCDMHNNPVKYVSLEKAKGIINFLRKNRFLIVYFTGGEPTLHPKILDIVKYANDIGLVTAMTSNGTASKETINNLKKAGLYLLTISFDHWIQDICEKIRGHKGIKRKQEEIVKHCLKIGLRTHTLTFLNSYVLNDGIDNLVRYVNEEIGVPFGFCIPVKTDSKAYSLGQNLSEKDLSFENIGDSLKTILSLKKKGRAIANLGTYIEDTIRLNEGKTPNFYCKGGEDVIYVDWQGNVYPCFVKEKLFNIFEDKPKFLKKVHCNDCLTNCFREPSILTQLFMKTLVKETFYSLSKNPVFL